MPGARTKTSIIGTTICGSSSRGNRHHRADTEQHRCHDDQRRQLRINEEADNLPGETELVSVMLHYFSRIEELSASSLLALVITVFPRAATRIGFPPPPGISLPAFDQPHMCMSVSSDKHERHYRQEVQHNLPEPGWIPPVPGRRASCPCRRR